MGFVSLLLGWTPSCLHFCATSGNPPPLFFLLFITLQTLLAVSGAITGHFLAELLSGAVDYVYIFATGHGPKMIKNQRRQSEQKSKDTFYGACNWRLLHILCPHDHTSEQLFCTTEAFDPVAFALWGHLRNVLILLRCYGILVLNIWVRDFGRGS